MRTLCGLQARFVVLRHAVQYLLLRVELSLLFDNPCRGLLLGVLGLYELFPLRPEGAARLAQFSSEAPLFASKVFLLCGGALQCPRHLCALRLLRLQGCRGSRVFCSRGLQLLAKVA